MPTVAALLPARMTALAGLRVVTVPLLVGLGAVAGAAPSRSWLLSSAAYLALTTAASPVLRGPWRAVRAGVLAACLVADSLYLELARLRLGDEVPVWLATAAFLVLVCLVTSRATATRVAALQSVWFLLGSAGAGAGAGVAPTGQGWVRPLTDLLLLWLVVVSALVGGALHGRELQRRHGDAEALQRLATALHGDTSIEAVARRVVRFVRAELRAPRAVVVRQHRDGLELLDGAGVAATAPGRTRSASSVLALASQSAAPTLVLRLNDLHDAWLVALLPRARRLAVVRLDVGVEQRIWLVAEHGGRASRVDPRWVAALGQAATSTALALSRVQLLATARLAASHDALTGVPNRRSLDELLAGMTERFRRSGSGFSVVMVDVDRFKDVNDRHGHQTGDEVLRAVAGQLRSQLRQHEYVARYGGEEFCVVLPDADVPQALAAAERLRQSLHALTGPVPVTASFGVAAVPAHAQDGRTATGLADEALLRAKAEGRDRVAVSA